MNSHKYESKKRRGVPHRSLLDRFTCAQRDSTGLATTVHGRHKEAFPGLAAHSPKDPLRWVHSAALILSLRESGLVKLNGESWTTYHKRVPEQRLCGYFTQAFLQSNRTVAAYPYKCYISDGTTLVSFVRLGSVGGRKRGGLKETSLMIDGTLFDHSLTCQGIDLIVDVASPDGRAEGLAEPLTGWAVDEISVSLMTGEGTRPKALMLTFLG
uniref:Uncharacterized protein n=1 Tax=Trichuris muris TaxID=70415 RepID=A0A5S6R0Q3_TRIMR